MLRRSCADHLDPYGCRNNSKMEPKQDMFIKVSDRRDIVDFVKEVEKYPCLYDKTLPEYANKVHNRRAWSAIAKRANTSIPDCRDKWRKIRISFMRSLKQQQSDKPPMRPYYLTQELHFLQPFIKVRPKSITDGTDKEHMDFEEATIPKHEISDSDSSTEMTIDLRTNDNTREINKFTYSNDTIPNIMKSNIENGHRINETRISYSDDIEGNPRKMFLLSMLPDVEALTESEMRIFRREVIMIVDNLMNKRSIRN